MFNEFTRYPRRKVMVFFKCLAHSASKESIPVKKDLPKYSEEVISHREIEERLSTMDDIRKEELETKINVFYTKNRYMPILMRLKKIKARYNALKKKKRYSKKKLNELSGKIRACEIILRRIERLDLAPKD